MSKLDLEDLTEEQEDLLRAILLERFTYFNYKIIEGILLKLKACSEKDVERIQHDINYYTNLKCLLNQIL